MGWCYVHSSCPGSHPSRVFKNGHWQSCEPRSKDSGGNRNYEEIQNLKDKIQQMKDGGDEDGGDEDLKRKIKDLEKVIKENALDGRWIDKKQENNPLEDTTIYTIKDKKVTDGKITKEITISEDPEKDPAIKIENFPKLKDETEQEDAEQQQEVTDWEADHQAPDKNEIKWKKPADTTWIRLKDKQIEELKKKIRRAAIRTKR